MTTSQALIQLLTTTPLLPLYLLALMPSEHDVPFMEQCLVRNPSIAIVPPFPSNLGEALSSPIFLADSTRSTLRVCMALPLNLLLVRGP